MGSITFEKQILEELQSIKEISLLSTKNVLSVKDMQTLTGFSISYLYYLTSKKEIPHYKRGKYVFFDRKEIESWLTQCKVESREDLERDYAVWNATETARERGRKL